MVEEIISAPILVEIFARDEGQITDVPRRTSGTASRHCRERREISIKLEANAIAGVTNGATFDRAASIDFGYAWSASVTNRVRYARARLQDEMRRSKKDLVDSVISQG